MGSPATAELHGRCAGSRQSCYRPQRSDPTAVADDAAVTSVKAHIVDANGNPVPGATVTFTIATGTATIVETNPVTTDANGDAIITRTRDSNRNCGNYRYGQWYTHC